MSTFSGFIKEIPGISVDHFIERNRTESVAFLISHCHSDHMRGLDLPDSLPGPLYASPISAVFLKHRFPQVTENVVVLNIGDQTTICLDRENNARRVHVTAIPAGHCPGSVMFLFENENQQHILYTGDFRIAAKDLRNIKAFKDLCLETVYLDSTFFNPSYDYFPAQSETLARLVTLCSKWLDFNNRNVISLKLSATFGSEYLFMELYRQLKEKVHVQHREWQQYRYLASLDQCVTPEATAARIHACSGTGTFRQADQLHCQPELDYRNIMVIRPSAMRWRHLTAKDPFCKILRSDREEYAICYSNHASYGELVDFLRYLRPKQVQFCVLGKEDTDERRMRLLVGNILADETATGIDSDTLPVSFNGIVYRSPGRRVRREYSDDETEEEDTSIHTLPKRRRNLPAQIC
ncbi:protein artemis-like [Malaya genurostris]|uniref:protein artemis-like n=1 Tax=Malaya genurostris TaxID=325434 RepID=UPI0026F3D3A5|nr:protein artemis-like [Malaya genurostris]